MYDRFADRPFLREEFQSYQNGILKNQEKRVFQPFALSLPFVVNPGILYMVKLHRKIFPKEPIHLIGLIRRSLVKLNITVSMGSHRQNWTAKSR